MPGTCLPVPIAIGTAGACALARMAYTKVRMCYVLVKMGKSTPITTGQAARMHKSIVKMRHSVS